MSLSNNHVLNVEQNCTSFCKGQLLETVQNLVNLGDGITKSKAVRKNPSLPIKRLAAFIKMCQLYDELYYIEKTPATLVGFLASVKLFCEFYLRSYMRLSDASMKQTDQLCMKEGFSMHNLQMVLSSQFIHPNRVYLRGKRIEDEEALRVQMLFREEFQRAQTIVTELDIAMDIALDTAELDIDEYCTIIQSAERIYQALSRYFHLIAVKQKALDLRASEGVEVDPIKAIVKVQSITRGHLARKQADHFRREEHQRLGLSIDGLLSSISKDRKTTFLKDLPLNQHCFPDSDLPPPPRSLNELDEYIRDHYFTPDPLKLIDPPPQGSLRKVDGYVENLVAELILAEAIKIIDPAVMQHWKFDDLITMSVLVKTRGKTSHVDLRNFLYASMVLPMALSPWKLDVTRHASILLVGDAGSGKTAWSVGMAEKCLATRLRISRKLFTRKFMGRKRLLETITQFVHQDGYSFVEFDRLEMFATNKNRKSPIKTLIVKLLTELRKRHCQIVGLSRTADLIPDVLTAFDYVITLRNPVGIDRYSLIAQTLAARQDQETLLRTPKRLFEISKATKKANAGETIAKVDAKFSKPITTTVSNVHKMQMKHS
uniref:Gluconokinase n=1 Tax=Panagrellus redivivus TaxID=6233 RepID=A0A7E4VY62_PANRE